MNSKQLRCIIQCDSLLAKTVDDVLAIDQLPNIVPSKPIGYIVNISRINEVGMHWVAMYFENNSGEFFDSFGNPPETYGSTFVNFLVKNCSHYNFNRKQLQDFSSDICGAYCIFYLICKSRGVSLSNIVNVMICLYMIL